MSFVRGKNGANLCGSGSGDYRAGGKTGQDHRDRGSPCRGRQGDCCISYYGKSPQEAREADNRADRNYG